MYESTGRLFKNDKKEAGDKRPDYTGDYTDENGKKWRLAAWLRDGQKGKWMSIKASEPQGSGQREAEQPTGGGDIDSQIPFTAETRI